MADLLWVPFSPWCVKSADGHYSVTKGGPDFDRTYSAWYAQTPQNRWAPGVLLEVYRDAEEPTMRKLAKARCQAHADEMAAKAAVKIAENENA
mgnify:CR=1 FL=1